MYRVVMKVGKDYTTEGHVWKRLKDSGVLVRPDPEKAVVVN